MAMCWLQGLHSQACGGAGALKALMSVVGRSLMKPTVSDRMTCCPLGSTARRSVGSSVSNSLQ